MQGLMHIRPNLPKGRDFPGRQIVTLAKAAVCVHGDSMMRNLSAMGPLEASSDGCAIETCMQASENVATEDFCCHTEA